MNPSHLPQSLAQGKNSDENEWYVTASFRQEPKRVCRKYRTFSRPQEVKQCLISLVAAQVLEVVGTFRGQGFDQVRKCETPNSSCHPDVPASYLFSSAQAM